MWFNHIYALNNIWVLTFIKMFALIPCDIQMKKWTPHIISGAWEHADWSPREKSVKKKIIIKCRRFWKNSAGFVLWEAYPQMNRCLKLANSDLERVDRMGCTLSVNSYKFERKKGNIFPCIKKEEINRRDNWCYHRLIGLGRLL